MPPLPAPENLCPSWDKSSPGLLLMLLFLGTFDVHWRDWRALLRRMGLLRLGHKRQKRQVLRVKWLNLVELRKLEQYNPPPLSSMSQVFN
jgi:hypothetical protein